MPDQLDRFLNTPCLNCGQQITDKYCAHCGQPVTDVDQSLGGLLGDFFNQGLSLDSRIWQTLRSLVTKPGQLTLEYLSGRRASFFTPIRLYLVMSLLYFSFSTLPGNLEVDLNDEAGAQADSVAVLTGGEALSEILSDESIQFTASDSTTSFLENLLPDEEIIDQIQQNPNEFISDIAEKIPHAMFAMVPIFGLLLWLCYIRRRLPYLHHLVIALHLHAFCFLVGFLIAVVDWALPESIEGFSQLIGLVVPVYCFLALRRVYGGGVFKTLFKLSFLGPVYWLLLILGLIVLAFIQMALY